MMLASTACIRLVGLVNWDVIPKSNSEDVTSGRAVVEYSAVTLLSIGHDEEELVCAHPELRTVIQGCMFDTVFPDEGAVAAT